MRPVTPVSRPGLRALRAALFAVVCAGMALVGHVSAGGDAPGPLVFWGAAAAVAVFAAPFAGRQWSAVALIAGLLGAQGLLHLAFLGASPGTASAEPSGITHAAGHLCGGGSTQGALVMLIAHVWAALVTGWWLSSGEEAFWAVLRWLGAVLLPPLVGTGPCPVRVAASHGRVPMPALLLLMLRHVIDGRAPPGGRARRPFRPRAA